MRSGLIMITLAAAAAAGLLAVSPANAADLATPYVGEVTGTNVYVRANAGMNSVYRMAKLSKPATVTVVGRIPGEGGKDGWLKIEPPANVYSVIAKQFVKADPAGKTGTLTGDNVWVRAGGPLVTKFSVLQARLKKGAKVAIIGEVNEYYKIRPPKGVHYYISDRYVAKRGQARKQQAPPVTAEPKKGDPGRNIAKKAAPKKDPDAKIDAAKPSPETKSATAALSAGELEKFTGVEELLMAEFKKPAPQRDLKGLIAKYKALEIAPDSRLKPYIDYRVKYLEAVLKKIAQRADYAKLIRATTAEQKALELKRTTLEITTTEDEEIIYAAEGVLAPSVIYTGGPTGPKRYILREQKTGSIVGYVQASKGQVNFARHSGKYVGVLGTKRYSPAMRTSVIEAEQIVVLQSDATLPMPPQPIVRPLPPPVMRAAPKPKATGAKSPKVKLPAKARPRPAPRPTAATKPTVKPLPATGLPVAKPSDLPATAPINEEEYD